MGARRSRHRQHLRVVDADLTTQGDERTAVDDPWAGEDAAWSDPETEFADAVAAADEEDRLGIGRALVIASAISLLLWLAIGALAYLAYRVFV